MCFNHISFYKMANFWTLRKTQLNFSGRQAEIRRMFLSQKLFSIQIDQFVHLFWYIPFDRIEYRFFFTEKRVFCQYFIYSRLTWKFQLAFLFFTIFLFVKWVVWVVLSSISSIVYTAHSKSFFFCMKSAFNFYLFIIFLFIKCNWC